MVNIFKLSDEEEKEYQPLQKAMIKSSSRLFKHMEKTEISIRTIIQPECPVAD